MTMGFKATVKTSMSTIGTTLGTIDSSAQYVKNFVDEGLEVQKKTRHLRVNKAVLEAKKDLAQDVAMLTEAEKQIIAALDSMDADKQEQKQPEQPQQAKKSS